MSILNYQKKQRELGNNFFFIGTIAVILINFLCFYCVKEEYSFHPTNNWNNAFDFWNLIVCVYSTFQHSNLQHLLLNSLCFLFVGAYVERKQGTIGLLFLVAIFTIFGAGLTYANHSGYSRGFSGVNFAFYAYIIVNFFFSIKEIKKNKIELIISITLLVLIYIACCFCGGTETFSFKIYPYDLIYNLGHYTGFLTGLLLTLVMKFCKIKSK